MRHKQQGFAQLIILVIAVGIIGGNIIYDNHQARKQDKLQDHIADSIKKDYG